MSKNETKAAKVQCAIDHKAPPPPAESLSKAHVISRLTLNSDPKDEIYREKNFKELVSSRLILEILFFCLNQQIYHISLFIYLKQMLV